MLFILVCVPLARSKACAVTDAPPGWMASVVSAVRAALSVRAAQCARFVGGLTIVTRVVAVLDQAVVQRLQADAENLGGPRLHAAALLECGQDQLTVRLGERRAEWDRD